MPAPGLSFQGNDCVGDSSNLNGRSCPFLQSRAPVQTSRDQLPQIRAPASQHNCSVAEIRLIISNLTMSHLIVEPFSLLTSSKRSDFTNRLRQLVNFLVRFRLHFCDGGQQDILARRLELLHGLGLDVHIHAERHDQDLRARVRQGTQIWLSDDLKVGEGRHDNLFFAWKL